MVSSSIAHGFDMMLSRGLQGTAAAALNNLQVKVTPVISIPDTRNEGPSSASSCITATEFCGTSPANTPRPTSRTSYAPGAGFSLGCLNSDACRAACMTASGAFPSSGQDASCDQHLNSKSDAQESDDTDMGHSSELREDDPALADVSHGDTSHDEAEDKVCDTRLCLGLTTPCPSLLTSFHTTYNVTPTQCLCSCSAVLKESVASSLDGLYQKFIMCSTLASNPARSGPSAQARLT